MEEVYWRYLFQGRIMFQGVIFMINDDILAGEFHISVRWARELLNKELRAHEKRD